VLIVLMGALGFLLGIVADIASLKKWAVLRIGAWVLLSALLMGAHILLALNPDRITLPVGAHVVGWVLLVGGGLLLFYSVFLEIPLSATYTRSTSPNQVVQDGTYALTRHPGVIWYGAMLIGLFLVSGARLCLLAAPVWFGLDVVWIWVGDRFVLGDVISGYSDYRKTTPMLIPTVASMGRCWRTFAPKKIVVGLFTGKRLTRS
jgi:protein-S-isoprenylcysteine O-methyltransferase Ste14